MRQWLWNSIVVYFLIVPTASIAQTYILNGNATQNTCNCYTLTQAINWQAGSVWNATKINLNNPFDFVFNVYLGCQDANGADGIVFMLQPISTSLGGAGGGIGFQGVAPSVGITLDTWQNTEFNDPAFDHISIQANGVIAHGTDLAGPIQASSSGDNIEDCNWHLFRIRWEPSTFTITTYFDGVQRLTVQNNIISTIFNNDPMVYWGFTSATGGANNLHQFCTALNPDFNTNFAGNTTCIGTPVTFSDLSQSFAPIQSWFWEFGDGTTSTLQNPPPHLYALPGIYQVKLTITGFDGCVSQAMQKTVTVGSKPVAAFQVSDTCFKKIPRITDQSTNTVGNINQWNWIVDGSVVSNAQFPSLAGLPVGTHSIKLVVKSVYGCESDTAYGSFVIKPIPQIEASFSDGCAGLPIQFTGTQTDNNTQITQWLWNFGDGQTNDQPSTIHIYANTGNFTTSLSAQASNGCKSDTAYNTIRVTIAIADAGKDTMVLKGIPFQLSGTGGLSFEWSPPTGLSDPSIANPTGILDDDMTYFLRVVTAEGCEDTDTIKITVFKGSAVYVPTGFTPNNDGLNDLLRPKYIGIRRLDYFRIYNRWGQLVYSTKDTGEGWDGTINGNKQTNGTFVWMLRAEDYAGKIYTMRGTSTLIR